MTNPPTKPPRFGLEKPRPEQPRNRGPALSLRTRRRIAEIEDRLSKGEARGDITRDLVDVHGVLPRTVRRWMRAAELRWAGEASEAGREGRRAQLRATAWKGVRLAFERQGLQLDREGGEHFYANPDVGSAGRLLEFLARLDGDLQQPNAATVNVGFGDDFLRKLSEFYNGGYEMADVVEMPAAPALPDGEDG